jgi:hypothetical protein
VGEGVQDAPKWHPRIHPSTTHPSTDAQSSVRLIIVALLETLAEASTNVLPDLDKESSDDEWGWGERRDGDGDGGGSGGGWTTKNEREGGHERERCRRRVGKQDTLAAAWSNGGGGF